MRLSKKLKNEIYAVFNSITICHNGPSRFIAGTDWGTNYDKAMEAAKKENKNVLVYFTGSDWCHPCKMLKKDLFSTSDFKTMASDYILLYIDLPRNKKLLTPEQLQHNKKLLPKLNKRGIFPLFKILDSQGDELDEHSGYSMNGEISKHLALLDKYRKKS